VFLSVNSLWIVYH